MALSRIQSVVEELSQNPYAHGADENRERVGRRSQGAFFTPLPLVDFVVSESLQYWLSKNTTGQSAPQQSAKCPSSLRVLDPACGDGRFLQSVKRWAEKNLAKTRLELIGFERDKQFAAESRNNLGANAEIHQVEALTESPASIETSIDLVVGNPPYLRSIGLAKSDPTLWGKLQGSYHATSHGEWDLYGAFLEHSLRWLSPMGCAGLVVPSRWLTAQNARLLRRFLGERGAVRGVVDFGGRQLFKSATTYTSVVFLQRMAASTISDPEANPQVDVAKDSGKGWAFGNVSRRGLGENPWHLCVGRDKGLIERLLHHSRPLKSVARVAKGTGTNADRVFVLNDGHGLEGELVIQCLRGRDIRGYGNSQSGPGLLFPYKKNGKLLSKDELAEGAPSAWNYLCRQREALEAREKGRFIGESFYQYGRPQNLLFHLSEKPKVVIPDIAKGGRALLDTEGTMCLDSSYAIRPLTSELPAELLLGIFNSRVVGLWLSLTGIPLRGGYQRLKTAYVNTLPIPPLGKQSQAVLSAVTNGETPDAVDELVRRWYDVPKGLWA